MAAPNDMCLLRNSGIWVYLGRNSWPKNCVLASLKRILNGCKYDVNLGPGFVVIIMYITNWAPFPLLWDCDGKALSPPTTRTLCALLPATW